MADRTVSAQLEAIYPAIGARVRIIREALGLTQLELSKRVGMVRPSIANFETGRQRILLHDVERFATALGTTPKNLLKGIWT